jgi:hypothetical protein
MPSAAPPPSISRAQARSQAGDIEGARADIEQEREGLVPQIDEALEALSGTVVQDLMRIFVRMILAAGFFQVDPHPGNLFVTRDGRIVILDFGLARQLPEGFGPGSPIAARRGRLPAMPDFSLFGDEHVRQYEATAGKVSHDWNGTSVLIPHTKGRKSGQTPKFPLIYGRVGADYVVVASNYQRKTLSRLISGFRR